jgi:hypothetical protein
MRYLLLVLLFVGAGCTKIVETDRTFDGVFEVPSTPKDKIYSSTKIWIAETFRSAKAVIEYDNKEEGTLIGNGVIKYPCSGLDAMVKGDWSASFTMRVDVKDNKFKITFTNIGLSWPPSYNKTYGAQPGHDGPVANKSDLDKIRPKLLAFGNELVIAIQKGGSKKDF